MAEKCEVCGKGVKSYALQFMLKVHFGFGYLFSFGSGVYHF